MAITERKAGKSISDVFIYLSMWVVVAITLYPFIYVLSMSISEPQYVVDGSVWLYPKGFSLSSYRTVFVDKQIWIAYYNTVFYTVVGSLLSVTFTMLAAFPLSRRDFFARNWIMAIIVITMFFGGGLIPSYLLIQELGLYDTRWAILLPGLTGAFYIIITRTFLQSIPDSLSESAKIDGANDIRILRSIILPLSKPILAVLTLFFAVGYWNSYFSALIYLSDVNKQPVSLFLVKVLVQNQDLLRERMASSQLEQGFLSVQLKYALIIIVILPILIVYPFLQKYFVKGVMIGSLKE